jgi:hypothetical protein
MKRAPSSGGGEGAGCGSGRNGETNSSSGGAGVRKRLKLQLGGSATAHDPPLLDSGDAIVVEHATNLEEPVPTLSDACAESNIEQELSFSQTSSTYAAPSSTVGMFSQESASSLSPVRHNRRDPSMNMDISSIAASQEEVNPGPRLASADDDALGEPSLHDTGLSADMPDPDGLDDMVVLSQSSVSSLGDQVQSPFVFSMHTQNRVQEAAVQMNQRASLGLVAISHPGLASSDDLLAALPVPE